jgi:hypothetical protein
MIINSQLRYVGIKKLKVIVGIIDYININTKNNNESQKFDKHNNKRTLSSSSNFTAVGSPSCSFVSPSSNIVMGHDLAICFIVCISPHSQSGESVMPYLWSR